MILYQLWRSLSGRNVKACQLDRLLRHQVVGVDGITACAGTADEVRFAIVYGLPSGEGNYPEVPFAAGVSVCALAMPKQIGSPYAPKWCRPNIGARRGAESTAEKSSIIDPGSKPHGPAVHRYFTV